MSDKVEPINKTIDVKCSPEAAFNIFTEQMNSWWPLDGNTISAMNGGVAKSVTLEPRVGGQVFEITADGEREDWARVEVFEPGKRLVLAWHVMSSEDQATKVEVDFVPNGDGTRVELTHTGWEILEDRGQQARDNYNGGWVNVFEVRFGEACG